jgi:hypothetical protein
MGFFDFLKKRTEEKKQINEIKLNEVSDFIDSKSKILLEETAAKTDSLRKQIAEEINQLKENLDVLEKAELKNPDIPDRMKQIMEGNRATYINRTMSFLNSIVLPETKEQILGFVESFDKELGVFDRSIGKNHRVMEEFFVEKAGRISSGMKSLDKLVKEIKFSIENPEIKKINQLKNKYFETKEKINSKKNAKEKIKSAEKELKRDSEVFEEKEKSLGKLQKTEDYQNVLGSINRIDSLKKEINEVNTAVTHCFSVIEPAMKKYWNLSENKLAKKYLEDSLIAFSEDKELEIINLINAMKIAIGKGDIELRDKKRDKILNELNASTKERFAELSGRQARLIKQISDEESKIKNSEILKEIKTAKETIRQDEIKIHEQKSALEKMKKDAEDADVSELISELENEIKIALGEDVKILS